VKVLINGYSVDFTVDDEKTLKDIAGSITDWSQKRDLIFTDLYIDGEPYSVDDLPDVSLDLINEINCLVQSKSDLIISTLSEGVTYCERILGFISESNKSGKSDFNQKESFVTGIEWLNETLQLIFNLLSLDMHNVKYLDRSVAQFSVLLSELKEEIIPVSDEIAFQKFLAGKKDLFEMIKSIFKMLFLSDNLKSIIMKSIDSPEQLINGLKQIKEAIPSQLKSLEQAAVSFQTGKDSEGSDLLQTFIDFIYKYIRLCHHVSPVFGIDPSTITNGSRTLEETNTAIYAYLEEIVSVMENNDIISLSDILEYQMKGELENCERFIDLMLEKIA
jgi:hypothetical protein